VRNVATLILSALLAGCLGSTPTTPKVSVDLRSVTVNGTARSYLLLTEGLEPAQSRPLLLLYHGAGGNAQELLNGTGIALRARAAGMIVASLEAIPGYGGRWATNPVDLPVADDVQFTRIVVSDVEAAGFTVDRSRVYAVGFSRGGDFVFQLACRANDLVRGVASVAATMLYTSREWCDTADFSTRQPGVAVVLGSVDPLMPWAGGLANRMGAMETTNYWAERLGCATTPPVEGPQGSFASVAITRYLHETCGNGDVRLYRLDPFGHEWPAYPLPTEDTLLDWFTSLPPQPTAAAALKRPSP
jgi:polyhydroxybutyrate depolymerase